MEPKPFRMADFRGKNNVLQPEQAKPNEFQVVKNVYVNDAGKIRRRKGYHRVYTGNVHSLFSNGESILFREGTDLKRLEADYSATVLRSGITGGRPMKCLDIGGRVFFTDGVMTGLFEHHLCRTWGLEVPALPRLSVIPGLLPAGRYQVATTFIRADGQEGGAPRCASLDVPAGSGIAIDNLSMSLDPTVFGLNIYVTATNGEVPFRIAAVENGTKTLFYTGTAAGASGSSPLLTQFMEPPPAGQLLTYYHGRIYIAAGNVLWYTERDYAVELCSLRRAFIPFPSRVTLLGAVQNGLWVSTLTETGFILGDPTSAEARWVSKAKYGAIEGTGVEVHGPDIGTGELAGHAWMWTTPSGICCGGPDGFFKNLTDGRVVFPAAVAGVGAIKHEEDAKLYLVGLYFSNVGLGSLAALLASGTGLETEPPPP
jgi:hypothetical protein